MHNDLRFLLDLAIILSAANLGGFISKKLNQPSVLGQIIMGLVLGPSILNLVKTGPTISHMAEIGVILLMFIAGLETDIADLKASSKSSTFIALGGVLLPFIFGVSGIFLLKSDAGLNEALFVGVLLTATSVSITVQALKELNRLRTKQGIGILGAAIIDDVIGIIMLTLIVGITNPTQGGSIFVVIEKIAAFFTLSVVLGIVFSKLLTKYSDILSRENRILTSALIFCFAVAFIAEELGVAAIIGAYFTGILFSTTPHRNRVSHEIQTVAYALFTPIFFTNIGLSVQLRDVISVLGFSMILIFIAIVGKVVGCGVGAILSNFTKREALQIGIGMVPRGEVALIIANLGLKMQLIDNKIFATVILISLVTTIVTPPLLKLAFGNEGDKKDLRINEC